MQLEVVAVIVKLCVEESILFALVGKSPVSNIYEDCAVLLPPQHKIPGTFYIRYSPSTPHIALDPQQWLPASTLFTIACTVVDLGNPPGRLTLTTPNGKTTTATEQLATVVQVSLGKLKIWKKVKTDPNK